MSGKFYTEQGEIIKILPNNRAKIKVKKSSICESCSHRSFCDPFGSQHMLLEAKNDIMAKAGQNVNVEFRLEKPLKAIVILYIIPLFAFLIGAVFGQLINPFKNKDASAVIFSLFFLIVSFLVIRWIDQHKSNTSLSHEPKIISIASL